MVVHPRAHKLSEGIIGSLSDPAVDDHALSPKADCLSLEVTLLEEKKRPETLLLIPHSKSCRLRGNSPLYVKQKQSCFPHPPQQP